MTHALAILLGVMTYALLAWSLGVMAARVVGPVPVGVKQFFREGWHTMVKTYFTVRYEEDDEGLWQVVEESATGDRYRVHIRDDAGEMKW